MPPVILNRHPRPESWLAKPGCRDESHDALTVAAPGLEQFEHPLIVDRFANQGPAHNGSKVIVANTRAVGIGVGALHGFGGRPDTNADD